MVQSNRSIFSAFKTPICIPDTLSCQAFVFGTEGEGLQCGRFEKPKWFKSYSSLSPPLFHKEGNSLSHRALSLASLNPTLPGSLGLPAQSCGVGEGRKNLNKTLDFLYTGGEYWVFWWLQYTLTLPTI